MAHAAIHARQPRRVPVDPRHFVVLVLRRDAALAVSRVTRRMYLGGNESVVTLLLAVFSIGVGCRLAVVRAPVGTQDRDRPGAVRLDRPDVVRAGPVLREPVRRCASHRPIAWSFAARPGSWRILLDLALIGAFGGFYIVPLYALVQSRIRSRASLARYRREQHSQRAVHGRRGGFRRGAAGRRRHASRNCSWSRRC